MARFQCSFCNFSCPQKDQESQFFRHLLNFHSNEPNFQIFCNHTDCNRTFTKIRALQKHWLREHGNNLDEDINDDEVHLEIEPDVEDEFNEESARRQLQFHTAKFLLATKEGAGITQTTLDSVKQSSETLIGEYFDIVKKVLVAKIRDVHQDFEFSQDMEDLFDSKNLFDGLETEHRQRAYYLNHFNLVVSL